MELTLAYHWNGQYDQALALLETLWAESPSNWVAMRMVPTYARVGRWERARAFFDELLARREREYVPPFVLAACASGLGDHEGAMAFCVAAAEDRDVLLPHFHSWLPDLEPLRADPRFARLVQQFNARMRS
jgi:predicted Zn-dependent protease